MKQILAILFTAITLFACSAPEYKIEGSIDGAEGATIRLGYSNDGMSFTATDSAVVENGKFQFNGKQKGCKIYYIEYPEAMETPLYAMFFLEGGNIKVDILPEYYHITGTPTNDLNTAVEETLTQYTGEIHTYQDSLYNNDNLSDQTKDELNNKCYITQCSAITYIQDVVRENIESMAGLYLLVQYSNLFDDEELEELASKIPSANKDSNNNPLYEILLAMQEERNSPGSMEDILRAIEQEAATLETEDGEESQAIE